MCFFKERHETILNELNDNYSSFLNKSGADKNFGKSLIDFSVKISVI